MTEAVIDASALLALLKAEPGAETVFEAIPTAVISAVNLSEVIAKLTSRGMPGETIKQTLKALELEVIPFDEEQAYQAGLLRASTQTSGISLGDRACLSLAKMLGVAALTADKTWGKLKIGVIIRVIR